MTCPVCGTVTVPGARFCHSCGHALPAAASLPAAERAPKSPGEAPVSGSFVRHK